jgi:uroporphyrinogen decarboxylase
MERTENCLKKLDRMNKTLRHEEADRVPVSDFFWSGFLDRWKKDLSLPPETNIYKYYDLDWIVTVPNMDPHIKEFEIIKDDDQEIIVRTGYEAVIKKNLSVTMPAYISFDTDTLDKMKNFQFDDPSDNRRYFKGGDNQIAGVGDCLTRNLPPWIDTVKSLYPDFPVYGSICEAHEQLWRIIGSENVLMWIGLYPEELGQFIKRVHNFLVESLKAQIKASDNLLAGMVIWGDVAYVNSMLFSPQYWRKYFKPCVKEMIDICHDNNLPVIYHGCGNVLKIFEDFIEMGLDAYNPLEAKAGLDVVDLRKKYGHHIGFCGNMDVMQWSQATQQQLKEIVLRKLNAAKGGGYIFQSDHSVPDNVSGQSYDYVVKLILKYGQYPLQLGQYDIPELG